MATIDIESFQILSLTNRVKDLEDKVFKKSKKEETTRAQQMLILKHLGILEILENLKLNKKNKAQLLSVILNMNADNIEDDLTTISSTKSPLVTEKNYNFLVKTFESVGLKDKKEEAETILENIHRKG